MIQLKSIFFILPVFIFLIITFIIPDRNNAKVYKKIHKDGTVEYYNRDYQRQRPRGRKQRFNSRFDNLINTISKRNGVDPYLIKCIIKVESDFNPNAISAAGAMGLMQLMQDTARYYKVNDALDPRENLEIGTKHFKNLMNYFHNDVPLALAAYHAGLGRVRKRMAVPPIRSTIAYVNRIMYYYTGTKRHGGKVKKLYKKIARDGTIIIYSK